MIEISRDMNYIYRLNPYNPRIVDKRPNRRGGRWQHYDYYTSEEEARTALLALERPAAASLSEGTP